MTKPTSTKQLYLYAITPAFNGESRQLAGLDGAVAYPIIHGRLSAVVSQVSGKLRPERRHLAAHQAVLKQLMEAIDAVLPVAFGVVANGPEAILGILRDNEKPVLENLGLVTRRVEMGLRVTWDVPNIFEYFVETHEDLRLARDQFTPGRRQPTQDDKIELGQLFERVLNDERDEHAERVSETLRPACVDIKRNDPRNEREVVSLACLVERGQGAKFETAVFEAAKLFDNNYAFDYNGPWAPHHFVDVRLDLRSLGGPKGSSARPGAQGSRRVSH